MTDQDLLLDFIDCIYECGSGGQSWTVFLRKFDKQFPAVKTAFTGYDANHRHLNFVLNGNYENTFFKSYEQHYHSLNPWFPFLHTLPPLTANVWAHDFLPLEELHATEFYHDWLKPQGDTSTGFSSILDRSPHSFINLNCNVSLDHLAEGRKAHNFLLLLEPHIQRSFAISRKLKGTILRSNTMETILDRQGNAILLLDEDGRLDYANEKGEELLRAANIVKCNPDHRLVFTYSKDQINISKQIRHLMGLEHTNRISVKLSLPEDNPFIALITPVTGNRYQSDHLMEGMVLRKKRVMITLIDPLFRPADPERLIASAYGTTPAETRLVLALLQGLSVRESAEQAGTTYQTARSQLQVVFRKLDVRSQSHLVQNLSKILNHSS